MKLLEAIAFSIGNKAQGLNDQAQEVIVQERYTSPEIRWFHVWHSYQRQIVEADIENLDELRHFEIDANGDYWRPVR
jgi:hypothetical protein